MEKSFSMLYNSILRTIKIVGEIMKGIKKVFIIVPIILIVILILLLCNGKEYCIEEIFEVSILGTENYGYAKIELNSEFVAESKVDLSKFSYSVDKNNNLSNNDVVSITINNAAGLKFDKKVLRINVTGLKKGTDLDIFKDLVIEYNEAEKKLILDNSMCSEFIKDNVLFAVKREKQNYDLGETVVIIGYVDMNAATDNRYNIIKTEIEYIIK